MFFFRSIAASEKEGKISEQEESKNEAKVTTENGAIPKSPNAVTLEEILASAADTPL